MTQILLLCLQKQLQAGHSKGDDPAGVKGPFLFNVLRDLRGPGVQVLQYAFKILKRKEVLHQEPILTFRKQTHSSLLRKI